MIAPGWLSNDRSSMDSATCSMTRLCIQFGEMSLVPHLEEWRYKQKVWK